MKDFIEILHWTPFGIVTVPMFKFGTKEGLWWFFINGLYQGTFYGILILWQC